MKYDLERKMAIEYVVGLGFYIILYHCNELNELQ